MSCGAVSASGTESASATTAAETTATVVCPTGQAQAGNIDTASGATKTGSLDCSTACAPTGQAQAGNVDTASGAPDAARSAAFMQAYSAVRPLEALEQAVFGTLLRGAAMRFWLSRLWDFYLPRQAAMLQAHDPTPFERILRQRIAQAHTPTP